MGDTHELHQRQEHGIRKRTSNACNRCRQQKIRCSGSIPCVQCLRKDVRCSFDGQRRRTGPVRGVDSFQARLGRPGGLAEVDETLNVPRLPVTTHACNADVPALVQHHESPLPRNTRESSGVVTFESDVEPPREHVVAEQQLTNPLVSCESIYVTDFTGKPLWLGTSSNWSFGRRILSTAHQHVFGSPLPTEKLLFEGRSYDLGWSGNRTTIDVVAKVFPTVDFAVFLINAVKFHCCQLFHLFDDVEFMQNFKQFHDGSIDFHEVDKNLWRVHYLLVLALGKALVARIGKDKKPTGADLFIQAIQLLPDPTFLNKSPIQAIEILCCAAIYYQCLDMRVAAFSTIGQAVRMALVWGLHTDMQTQHQSEAINERCRAVWWTVYVLDCHMSSWMGTPISLAEQDINARLPTFARAPLKSAALAVHVKLAKTTNFVLRTVYGEDGRMDNRFVTSIKSALRSLASVNDERDSTFRIDLKEPSSISRVSAYIHLFHHQCIILATRPLLYTFWQRRLATATSTRIRSSSSIRSLVRICVASAQTIFKILDALQAQALLESFLPFDLECTWASALVILVTSAVDPSLVGEEDRNSYLQSAHALLDEMIARGNLIAASHKAELLQMDETLTKMQQSTAAAPYDSINALPTDACTHPAPVDPSATNSKAARVGDDLVRNDHLSQASEEQRNQGVGPSPGSWGFSVLNDWNSEEGVSGEQLLALADALNFADFPDFPETQSDDGMRLVYPPL